MRHRFGGFLLDTDQFQLLRSGEPVHVEPMVFDLLRLFVENPGLVIDRDRMIAEVWRGRIVSEATLSTAVKSARQALGDSGEAQSLIETVRSRGFRFAAAVTAECAAAAPPDRPDPTPEPAPTEERGQPGVAVLPFTRIGDPASHLGFEEAIPFEIIVALSRLRALTVIARGSTFRFRGPEVDLAAVGRALGVGYCLTGSFESLRGRIAVGVELAETEGGRVIWGERFAATADDVHRIRSEIVSGVVSAVDAQIALNEALRAQGLPTEALDAWQAFHLGMRRVNDYTRDGNEAAEAMFRRAVALAPGFARAHAGLAFTHFQNAFLGYLPERAAEVAASRRAAERAITLDPQDPFSNFTMGRSFWLSGELDLASPWLERATSISPNYAQGLYSWATIDVLSDRTAPALANGGRAMELSPLDPLLYAMRATRALAHLNSGDLVAAASWAEAGARTPRANAITFMIAAAIHDLADHPEQARHWAAAARERDAAASQARFFEALPLRNPRARQCVARALTALDF